MEASPHSLLFSFLILPKWAESLYEMYLPQGVRDTRTHRVQGSTLRNPCHFNTKAKSLNWLLFCDSLSPPLPPRPPLFLLSLYSLPLLLSLSPSVFLPCSFSLPPFISLSLPPSPLSRLLCVYLSYQFSQPERAVLDNEGKMRPHSMVEMHVSSPRVGEYQLHSGTRGSFARKQFPPSNEVLAQQSCSHGEKRR